MEMLFMCLCFDSAFQRWSNINLRLQYKVVFCYEIAVHFTFQIFHFPSDVEMQWRFDFTCCPRFTIDMWLCFTVSNHLCCGVKLLRKRLNQRWTSVSRQNVMSFQLSKSPLFHRWFATLLHRLKSPSFWHQNFAKTY